MEISMNTVEYIKNYNDIGFLKENHDKSKEVYIKKGDIIKCDNQGYLWFKNVCFWSY